MVGFIIAGIAKFQENCLHLYKRNFKLLNDERSSVQGGKAASQAYWNALSTLRSAWKEVFNEDLPTEGNLAKSAFEQAISQIKQRLANDSAGAKRLRLELDLDIGDDIAEVLLSYANIDDLPPNVVKHAIREECIRLGEGRHELRSVLRPVLDSLFSGSKTRRPRVGANRHWPRLLQYLRELEEDTDWSPAGRGLRLMNAGSGGRVAAEPADPATLAVRIDPDFM